MPAPTSVYVHFPFCAKKCPYCDFATRAIAAEDVPSEAYADVVLRELEERAPSLAGRELVSIFFGGGTPSLWAPRELGRVLEGVRKAFETEDEALEITVECNPSSLDETRAKALADEGVNRLSVGVQALDDDRLSFLGRRHDAKGAVRALSAAIAAVPRVSGDFIFGTPEHRKDAFGEEIRRAVDLGIRHVSAYALTIEPGTLFGELARSGRLPIAPDETYASLFVTAEEIFAEAGLQHYEVSNYAVPGEESVHNAHYWKGGSYLGLGAAAVGCLDGEDGHARRYRNVPDPARYLGARDPAEREESEERLDPETRIREALMLGLRTREGVDLQDLEARLGVDPRRGRERALERRIMRGDVILEGDQLRIPTARWLHLDGIVADLF